jgi:Methyltransferase domain
MKIDDMSSPSNCPPVPVHDSDSRQQFHALLEIALKNHNWIKLRFSKYCGTEEDLQHITVRPITLRNEEALSFVYSYKTRDITKNLSLAEGTATIHVFLENDFRNIQLFGDNEVARLEISKRGRTILHTHAHENGPATSTDHDRAKRRLVDITLPFLQALGITDARHKVIPAMAGKWKQINKFVEIFSQALNTARVPLTDPLTVVDFGSGKGYLTFAIHSHLHNTLHNEATVTGVEQRKSLVDLCNAAVMELGAPRLHFVCGDVKTHAPENCDAMIALHACDTATDYAIHYGIRAQASIIMCSPCCHKQLRPQMHSPAPLKPMLQYGVHLGQEADMVTDTLRALLLEANGYNAKVFEFVSTEHTDKNKMILAVKRSASKTTSVARLEAIEQISAIKDFYAIREHCLERLLQQ